MSREGPTHSASSAKAACNCIDPSAPKNLRLRMARLKVYGFSPIITIEAGQAYAPSGDTARGFVFGAPIFGRGPDPLHPRVSKKLYYRHAP